MGPPQVLVLRVGVDLGVISINEVAQSAKAVEYTVFNSAER